MHLKLYELVETTEVPFKKYNYFTWVLAEFQFGGVEMETPEE